MALFYFHLVSPNGYEVDEIGCEFSDVETAYLQARAAAVEMCVDIMRERHDPLHYQFEIFDCERRFLIELPFSEVIRPKAISLEHARIRPTLLGEIRRAEKLHLEVRDELTRLRAILDQSVATLARSRSS
jgi:hypothetical protein